MTAIIETGWCPPQHGCLAAGAQVADENVLTDQHRQLARGGHVLHMIAATSETTVRLGESAKDLLEALHEHDG